MSAAAQLLGEPVEADAAAADAAGQLAWPCPRCGWRPRPRARRGPPAPAPWPRPSGPRRSPAPGARAGRRAPPRPARRPRPTPTPSRRRCGSEARTCLPTSSAWRKSWLRIAPAVPSSAAISQAWRTWPWISLSPTTIESRLEATRKSWVAARSSRRTYRAQASSSSEMWRVGDQRRRQGLLGRRVGRGRVDLGAVAGGEGHGLRHRAALGQVPEQGARLGVREGRLLALGHRRGLVGEPEDEERHAGTPMSRTRVASSRAPASSPSARRRTTSVSIRRSTASRRLGMSG